MESFDYCLHNDVGIGFPPLYDLHGELYFGRFRAITLGLQRTSIIGKGGAANIHFVRDEVMDREVALKIPILRNEAMTQQEIEQIRKDMLEETRKAMELTHPNIVRIHDFHQQDGRLGISMQFVYGRNLHNEQYPDGSTGAPRPYEVEAIRQWIAQLCDALQYIHEDAHMVHRDIKPKNLMLERRQGGDKLLITDFGITQRLRHHALPLSGDQARSGENKFTREYAPWQQIEDDEASKLDDVYSVGATIYSLITGRPPFYEGGDEQIKVQIKETVPPSMEQRMAALGIRAPDVPREWEEVVAACLSKRPEDRPQSMRELARALGVQSGSDTVLDALVQDQKARISELEEEIETNAVSATATATATATEQLASLAVLKQELDEARSRADALEKEGLEASELARSAEEQLEALRAKLDEAERNIEDAGKSDDERLLRMREDADRKIGELEQSLVKAQADGEKFGEEALAASEAEVRRLQEELDTSRQDAEARSAQRISELEAELETVKDQTRIESDRVAAEFQPRIEALSVKIRALEAERDSAVASIREEAEKRLQKQADDLKQIQARLDKESIRRAKLEQVVEAGKNRHAASLRPVLVILLVALLVGLGGGYTIRKMKQPSSADAKWVEKELFESGEISGPVTWKQFEAFARSIGQPVEALVLNEVKKGKPDDPVTGVSWYVAQRFCDWLTDLEGRDTHRYVLPMYDELVKLEDPQWTWTSTWRDNGDDKRFIGFKMINGDGEPVELPPGTATKDTKFRVEKTQPANP